MPNNADYWAKRAQEIEESHIRDFEEYADRLERAFSGSREAYIQKMEYYLDRLAKTQGLTPEGAVQALNAQEIEAYRMSLSEYTKWAEKGLDAPEEVRKKLEQASIIYHLSYYQAMMNEMFFVTSKLWQEVGQDMTRFLGDKYANNYYSYTKSLQDLTGNYQHITGISWRNFRDVLNEPWAPDGKSFSSRIWENNARLATRLQEELTNVITGRYGKDKAAEAIASFSNDEVVKDYNVSLGNAKRLVHSEMHRLLDSGQIKAFHEQGVPMYQYSATLDLKTTPFCRHMDGKVFKVEEYEPGVTAPPHGPWCRSTIIPRYPDDDMDGGMRAMRNPKTDKTELVSAKMTYDEWYQEYVETE